MSDVATQEQRFKTEELRAIKTPQDAERLLGAITDLSQELGSGFEVLEDKSRLLGVGFLIIEWHWSQGDHGEFVSALAITAANLKLVINDGSTGIAAQLRELQERGITNGVLVRKGLRESIYWYDPANPTEKSGSPLEGYKRAVTYYLAV